MKRGRHISEGRMAAKVKCKAGKFSNQYGYRLLGKAGSKRSVTISSVKSLAKWFY